MAGEVGVGEGPQQGPGIVLNGLDGSVDPGQLFGGYAIRFVPVADEGRGDLALHGHGLVVAVYQLPGDLHGVGGDYLHRLVELLPGIQLQLLIFLSHFFLVSFLRVMSL